MSDRTELSSRINLFSRTVLSFREAMSSFIKFIVNLLTATSTRATVRTIEGYLPNAVYTDSPVILLLAIGEVAIKYGRRISEGVWSKVDINGVPFPTTTSLSNEDSATNIVLRSRTFDDPAWIEGGTPTISKDAVGVGGLSNTAYTIADDNGAAFEYVSQTVGITANTSDITVSLFVKKDDDEARFPALQVNLTGGTVKQALGWINTKTGATLNTGSAATVTSESCGNFWRLNVIVTKANNTACRPEIYPSAGTIIGTAAPSATGSAIFDNIDIIDNTSTPSSPIYTDAGTITRGPDINTVPVSGVHTKDLGFERLEFTPYVGGQVNKYLRSFYLDATHTLDLYINATQVIVYYVDGASTDSAAFTYSHLQDIPMTAEWGWDSVANKLRVRAAASSGDISGETFAEATFSGMTALPATSYIGCKNDSSQAAGEFGNPIDYISAEVAGVL